MMKRVNIGDVVDARKQMLFNAVTFDWEKEILTSITYKDFAVVIRKLRVPTFTIGLNEQLNDSTTSILEEKSVATTFFVWGDEKKGCSWRRNLQWICYRIALILLKK